MLAAQKQTPGDAECVYHRPEALVDRPMHYCPGCTHGIIHQLVGHMIDEFGLLDRTVGVVPVGCAVLAYEYFNFDSIEASHGRAPAVATAVKRLDPARFVFTYQGDGDLASIGIGETIHTAARGERITIVFVNNGIYGMTGGQMAPTSLVGQRTTTSPHGRDESLTGAPIGICELLSTLPGVAFAARVPLSSPKGVNQAKKYLRKAFRAQLEDRGLGIVEFLSTCPVQWHMTPIAAMRRIDEEVVKTFKPGVFVDHVDEAPPKGTES
ncbi:MAG: 2-oxoglutarate oxidoreductase [Planctomycetota bacterium]|nr:MAG: 2-oxoglutarate oxidoreductase [Planctomycetota bacterium]